MKKVLILVVALAFLAGLTVSLTHAEEKATPKAPAAAETKEKPKEAVKEEARCPVLGEAVKDVAKAAKSDYKGKTYYFCCPSCKTKFDADPEKFIAKKDEKPAAPAAAPVAIPAAPAPAAKEVPACGAEKKDCAKDCPHKDCPAKKEAK